MRTIIIGQEAREGLKRGIDLVANAVKTTLGPSGRNAVIGRLGMAPTITNDGVTIARNIEVENEIEQLGVMCVQEAAMLTDKKAGDGTTTTTVLLQKIVHKLFDKLSDDGSILSGRKSSLDTIALKKELDIWCEKVVEKLKESAKKVELKDLYDVALVSGEYEWIAKMMSDIYSQIGKDGYVSLEEGVKTKYDIFKGLEFNTGYPSEYFINNDNRECVINNPSILVANFKVGVPHILSIVEESIKEKRNGLVIVAPDFEQDIVPRLVSTKLKTGYIVVPLKLPTFGKNDPLLDISHLTNSILVDKAMAVTNDDLVKMTTLSKAGTVDKVIISDAKTILIGGKGDTTSRVEAIKKQLEETESEFDRNELEKRIAYLSGGLAIVKVGAESDFERTYFKLKIEDAINAVQIALKEGVVKGGGLALKEISEQLPENILTEALTAPYKQIQENAGGSLEIKENVVDAVATVISAVKNACSLAGMLVTTEVAIAHKIDKDDDK